MHCFINPQAIKTEIEKLGNTVTNIWNIKQYRTKLQLSMFSVELKPVSNNSHIKCRIYTKVQNKSQNTKTHKGYCSLWKLPKNMGTPKIIAISNWDASNMQVTT
jgi:hypothetical protein